MNRKIVFIYLAFFNGFFRQNDTEINNCHDKMGTSVIKIHVQVDELAQLTLGTEAMARLKKPMTPLTAVSMWFGEIFDDLNRDLQPYGVQFHGIFKDISTAKIPYERDKCLEPNPPQVRSEIARSIYLSEASKNNGKIGNRLIVFFCPNNFDATKKRHIRAGDCSNIMGFLFGPTPILRKTIKENLIKFIFRTKETSGDKYNDALCKIAKNCVVKKDSVIGQYVRDLKSVRHISSEKYILKDNEILNEHDLYDDIFVSKYLGKKEMKRSYSSG